MDRFGIRWALWGLCGGLALAGCGGSSTTGSHSAAAPQARLKISIARKIGAVCRRAESEEDRNVIEQFANRGYSIASPAAIAALRTAARDVAHESAQVTAAARNPATLTLARVITSEADALKNASILRHARSDEQLLLADLHRRIAVAKSIGVSSCAGAAADTLRPGVPSP